MKIACVHTLPLEYYPPARNLLAHLSRHPGWSVQAWTIKGSRTTKLFSHPPVTISRPSYPGARSILPFRMAGYAAWHLRTAAMLAAWRPDAVISVEPHSALAVWLYYRLFRGKAELFIHHHEYYAPEDFDARGMRLLRATRDLERNDLFSRAIWVSQTNDQRLRLLLGDSQSISRDAARSLPNYPPLAWVRSAEAIERQPSDGVLRMVYVGAASFEDTFIREAVEWAATHSERVSLHICADNIQPDVVNWIRSIDSRGVTLNENGVDYEQLPALLRQFDVGLVLYRGNTLNFVHNVPNKAIEYLACGLQVWYPGVMKGMVDFHQRHPHEDLREMHFEKLPSAPPTVMHRARSGDFPFTAESALGPLISELESVESGLR